MFLRLFSLIVFVLLFMALSCEEESPVEPSSKGTISGFVTIIDDETGLSKVNVFTNPATSSVTTKEDGSYQIHNVEAGTYRVTATKEGYDTLSVDVAVVGEKETIADFIISPVVVDVSQNYGYITGILYDKNSQSRIGGVNLKTSPSTNSVTTSSDGKYFISILTAGRYAVMATKNGFDSTAIDVSVSLGDTTIADIFMAVSDTTDSPTTGIASGRVIDAFSGEPLSDAIVTTNPATSVVNTNANGEYVFEKLVPGNYKIIVNKNGYDKGESEVLVTTGEETTANFSLMVSNGWISGSVTDSETGNILSGVLVTTNPGSSSVLTDSLGTYSINNLQPKSYTINAEKNGYLKSTLSITVSAGKSTQVDIVMSKIP
jgi:hypothetical protein